MTLEEYKKLSHQKESKYKAKKVIVNGIKFDSQKEATRYGQLLWMQKYGQISNLELQKKYTLIPSQYRDGKCVEREISYIADFVYEENGAIIVEDTKGFRTNEYIMKRKMMLFFHDIRIKEI